MARSIDHLVLAVRDIKAGRLFFQRLGFQPAPLGVHPFGTGNHNVFFDRSFLEVLSVLDAQKIIPATASHQFSFSAFNQAYLREREGVSMMVVNTEDARADEHRLREAGWQTYEPFHFSRPHILPNGSKTEVAFTSTFCTHPLLSNMAFFVCQHHHPEHVWQVQYQVHENGIKQFSEVDLMISNPKEVMPLLLQLFDSQETFVNENGSGFYTAKEKINLIRPEVFQVQYLSAPESLASPCIGAISFDLTANAWKAMQSILQKNNVPFILNVDHFLVDAKDAFGVYLKIKCLP